MNHRQFDIYLTLLGSLLKLGRRQREAIAEELRDHLEERVAELTARGVSEDEAISETLADFGDAAGLANQFSQIARTRRRRRVMKFTAGSAALVAVLALGVFFLWSDPASRVAPAPVVAQAPENEPFAGDSSEGAAQDFELIVDKPIRLRTIVVGQSAGAREREIKILRALDELTEIDCVETQMPDLMVFLSDYHHIQIFINNRALNENGMSSDIPITTQLKGISLRAALNLILEQLDLTYDIRDEVLMITTHEDVKVKQVTHIYGIAPLLGDSEPADYDSLIDLVTRTVAPTSWDEVGGPGSIAPFGPCKALVISQSPQVTAEIEDLLQQLLELKQSMDAAASCSVPPGETTPLSMTQP